jgi:hypothetical protein
MQQAEDTRAAALLLIALRSILRSELPPRRSSGHYFIKGVSLLSTVFVGIVGRRQKRHAYL